MFPQAHRARTVLKNCCPKGLVGLSPTPSARSDLQIRGLRQLHEENLKGRFAILLPFPAGVLVTATIDGGVAASLLGKPPSLLGCRGRYRPPPSSSGHPR